MKRVFACLCAVLILFGMSSIDVQARTPDVVSPQYVIIPVSKTFTTSPRSDVSITISGSYQRTGSSVNNISVTAYASNSNATVDTVSSFPNGSGIIVVVYYRVYGYNDLYSKTFYF